VRRAYASFTLAAELLITETIAMFKLPSGSRVLDCRLIAPSDGTTGQLDVGWIANGVDAADDDGFIEGATAGATGGDTGAAAVDSKMPATRPGWNKKFGAETEIQITALEATTASNTDKYQLEILYIVD